MREQMTQFGVSDLLTRLDVATLHQNGRLFRGTYSETPEFSVSLILHRLTYPISAAILWLHVKLDLHSVLPEQNLLSPPDPSSLGKEADVLFT